MIAAGLDGLHAVQPCCGGMDLARLKARYGKQILWNGAIDSHHVLIDGTTDLVRQKTREELAIMAPGGGSVAGASHDYILEETPVANVLAGEITQGFRHDVRQGFWRKLPVEPEKKQCDSRFGIGR